MMRLAAWTAASILLLFSACQKPVDNFTGEKMVPLLPRGNISNFYGAIAQSPDTVFTLAGSEPATVRTAEGVIIEIEPGAFSWSSGAPVEGTLQIHWTDLRRILHQVQHRVSMHYEASLLGHEFVCFVYAESEGESLTLTKPLLIKWPADNPMEDLKLWSQLVERQYLNDWIAATSATVSLSNWIDPVIGAGVNGYLFPVLQTGYWCGGREEQALPGSSMELQATFFPDYKAANTAVYFLQSGKNRAIALRDIGGGVFQFDAMPEGLNGRLFCVTEAVRKNFYTTWQDVVLNGNFIWKPRPDRTEIPAIYQMLQAM